MGAFQPVPVLGFLQESLEIRTSLDLVKEAPREVCKEARKNGGFSGWNRAPRWRNMNSIQHSSRLA